MKKRLAMVCAAGMILATGSAALCGQMYWADLVDDKIQRANLDGTSREDLVTTGLSQTHNVALDMTRGKMYWTDQATDKIQRANLDGSQVEDLITLGLDVPREIRLDVAGGEMYWLDAGADTIERANLDGTARHVVISSGLNNPISLALDCGNGTMYWTDNSYVGEKTIKQSTLYGSQVVHIATVAGPSYITVDAVGEMIYWTDRTAIYRADLDGHGVETLVTGLMAASGIALDVLDGRMYWTDLSAHKIQRSFMDGSNVEDLISVDLPNPIGIALDVPIPEPATLSFLALGGLALIRRRS